MNCLLLLNLGFTDECVSSTDLFMGSVPEVNSLSSVSDVPDSHSTLVVVSLKEPSKKKQTKDQSIFSCNSFRDKIITVLPHPKRTSNKC